MSERLNVWISGALADPEKLTHRHNPVPIDSQPDLTGQGFVKLNGATKGLSEFARFSEKRVFKEKTPSLDYRNIGVWIRQ
jgi:hypothetical protein